VPIAKSQISGLVCASMDCVTLRTPIDPGAAAPRAAQAYRHISP
jgi:hypothetical protein